jgi:hypothetical protein
MLKRFILCLGFFCLGFPSGPERGLAQTAVPISVSNQNPLVQIYGLPAAEEALLTPKGRTTARLSIDIANHFVKADTTSEWLYIDGESYRSTLTLRYGISDRAEIGLDLPYLMYRGGFLDDFLGNFHETCGYSSLMRDGVERNQLLFRYKRKGVEEIRVDDSPEGIGDIRLAAGLQVFRNDDETTNVSLRGSLKLPTGNEEQLLGSGSTDLALWLTASRLWPREHEFGLYGAGGILLMTEGEVLPELQRQVVGFGTLTLGWRPWQLLALKLQFDAQTPFYHNSSLDELNDPALQGTIGFTLCFTPVTSLDLAVVENLIKTTSPDVVFHVALRTRF